MAAITEPNTPPSATQPGLQASHTTTDVSRVHAPSQNVQESQKTKSTVATEESGAGARPSTDQPQVPVNEPANPSTLPPQQTEVEDPALVKSKAAVWPTKLIQWPPNTQSQCLIVMQARNGPCSLIALCNVLILRNDISIYPKNRRSVSYEYLASIIADYLVSRMSENDTAIEGLSAALSKLPDLQEGMDINSVWSSHTSFKQLGEGGELKLFQLCGVELVHGWLADPASAEYEALMKVGDYDAAVNMLVAADDLTKGQFVESDQTAAASPETPVRTATTLHLTEEQHQVVRDAFTIRNFLDTNSSQLTYNGLFTLSNSLRPSHLYAFFRNSHLSVLFKPASAEQPLYTLVTDSAFAREDTVVWETLEDVDGSASIFVDATFIKSSTAGGDYSGRSAEAAVRDAERALNGLHFDADLALAQQMQAEEDAAAQEAAQRRQDRRAAHQQPQSSRDSRRTNSGANSTDQRTPASSSEAVTTPGEGSRKKKKENKDCVIM